MNQLVFDNKEYPIKFDYNFYDRLIEHDSKKDDDSVDSFNRLIAGLVANDPDAIILAYQKAIVGKNRLTKGQVAKALDELGVWDSEDPFGDVYKEIRSAGFLKLKIKALLHSLKEDITTAKAALEVIEETSDKSKDAKKDLKDAQSSVAVAKKQYELTKKFLEQLAK